MFTLALALLLQLPFVPPPEVTLVRSSMAPLARVLPDGTLTPFGPTSPPGFARESGRLRFLAASEAVGVAVVEVADAAGGALYAIPRDGHAPVRLAATTSLGLDVALSPDGRRLLYVDGLTLHVVTLAATGPVAPAVAITPASPLPEDRANLRTEGLQWLDDQTIAYELEALHRPTNRITTTVQAAPADGSAPAHLLVPESPTQDRLAAVVGAVVLVYREGTLYAFHDGAAHPIGDHFGAGVVGVVGDRAVVTLGLSGSTHSVALATVDARGVVSPLTPKRTVYLDPLLTPDGQAVLYVVQAAGGWSVHRVALDGSSDRALTPASADPIELSTFVRGSNLVAGCRGDAVVIVDIANVAPPRVLTRAPSNPSCTIRGATRTHVAFERKYLDTWRVELLPIDGSPAVLARGDFGASSTAIVPASVAGLLGDDVILQTGWEGVGSIVASALGRVTTLVPWQLGDIHDAARTPDGATVVFRGAPSGPWRAVRLDHPRVIVDVTSPNESYVIGLTNDRLVGWDAQGQRFVAWDLAGHDARHPQTLLDGIVEPAPFAAPDYVAGLRANGTILSAPVDQSAPPITVMRCGYASRLDYDPVHRRVVAACMYESLLTILSADVLGGNAAHPLVLGQPRPPADTNLAGLSVLPSGNVRMGYATRYTAAPHPAGVDVLASNGSGLRSFSDAALAAPAAGWLRARTFATTPVADDGSGRETRTPLR